VTTGRDRALLLVAVLAISTGAVLIRGAEAAPPLVIAAYRVGLGSLIILLPGVRPDRWRSLGAMRQRTRVVAVIAGLFLAAHFATWIASLRYTSVASSVALVTAHPLIVAVVGRMVLGEKVPGRTLIGIVIGIAGVAWLASLDHAFGEGRSLLGDGLAFSGCVFMAGYVICGRWARSHAPLWPYLAITYSVAAVVLIGLAILDGGEFGGYSGTTVVCLVLLALIPRASVTPW